MTDAKKRVGRPPVITQEIAERACHDIAIGMPLELVAAAAEVEKVSLKNALNTRFRSIYARAKAEWMRAALSSTDPKGWAKTAWLLERSPAYREYYPRRPEVEVTQTQSVGLTFTPDTLADLERLARQQFDQPPAGKNQIEP